MNGKQLFLKPEEQKFLALAVLALIDDLKESTQNQKLNWNPESRKELKDMLAAGSGLKIKMANLGFDMRPLPDVEDGEIPDYLTKES